MAHRDSARETVLDAFRDLLVETTGKGASLEEVARRAGVTKGGLLYHFPSRAALEQALVDRLDTLSRADAETLAAAPDGAARAYAGLGDYLDSPLDRTTVAVGHIARGSASARAAVESMRRRYHDLLVEDLGDETLATAAMLLTDGLYYGITTGTGSLPQDFDISAFLDRMRGR